MFQITVRELAGMTATERARANIERFVGENAGLLQQMAARNRNRQIRQAIDEAEHVDGEVQPPE